MCSSNGIFGENNWWWIIVVIILIWICCCNDQGGCGDTNGRPNIQQTPHLDRAYAFGRSVYESEPSAENRVP